MLYVVATSFCLEKTIPFPVSFQPMKLSSSLIVLFLCLFVRLRVSLVFVVFFLSSFVFFFLYAFGKSYYHHFLILQRRINHLIVIVDLYKKSIKEARSTIQNVALAQAALKGKSDKVRLETYFTPMTSAIVLQNQK